MPYAVSYDKIKIFYQVAGSGDEVIVFVHGLGENHETWKEQISYFANLGFKVIALDLRGHGNSDIPQKRVAMEDFAEDVLAVLRAENVRRANFVGYSMGALVVLEVYSKNHEVFNKVVLEAFVPQYPPAQTWALVNMSMDEIARQVAEFAVWMNAPKELKEDIYRIISRTNKEVYIQSCEAATSKNYEPILNSMRTPILLIYGEYDFICPPGIGEQIRERMSNVELSVIKDVGHMPHRENSEAYNQIIREFFARK